MNRILTTIFIIMLAVVAVLQIMSLIGHFPKTAFTPVCPVNAISMQNGKAVIDTDKCIGCKRCVIGIPVPIREISVSNTQLTIPSPSTLSSDSIPSQPGTSVKTPAVEQVSPIKGTNTAKTEPMPKKKKDNTLPPAPVSSYKVDPAKCIGCTLCVQYCPVGAISMVNGKAMIDPAKCINCGICKNGNGDDYTGCPVSAIKGP